jgi:hypothetical protein
MEANMKDLNCIVFITMISIMPLLAQERQNSIFLNQVMTAQEMKETGVENLSIQQRAALEQWINNYTLKIIQSFQTLSQETYSGNYLGIGGGHWIKKNAERGKIIILEDNSMWEISSMDRIYTFLWLSFTNIRVILNDQTIGNYKYLLINTDDGEKAAAKYLGR